MQIDARCWAPRGFTGPPSPKITVSHDGLLMRVRSFTTHRRLIPPSEAHCGRSGPWAVRRDASPPPWAAAMSATMAGGSHSFNRQPTTSKLVTMARDGSHRTCVTRVSPECAYRSPRWSPDDRLLAFQHDSLTFTNCLRIVPAGGGEPREVARSAWLNGFAWRSEGSGLVYSSSRGSTLLYPPIFNLRTVGHDGRDDRQLTYGDRSGACSGQFWLAPAW